MTLNDQQLAAKERLKAHCLDSISTPFIVLEGPAGTGKTFLMHTLARELKRSFVFTAPTNKATRVLRESIQGDDYKPVCRTIYSLLGLQLAAEGEVRELRASAEDEVDLSDVRICVIDEGSMISSVLMPHIVAASQRYPRIRWIIMGDRWQLPPVKEDMSPIWNIENRVELSKIMRQDNTILQLTQHVRGLIQTPMRPLGNLQTTQEVKPLGAEDFKALVTDRAQEFLSGAAKVVAWRNIVVDAFNERIRSRLFAEHLKYPWQPGDRITVTEPVVDLEGKIIATTDEEGTVEKADLGPHPAHKDFIVWNIVMRTDWNQMVTLRALASQEQGKFQARVQRMAAEARADKKLWRDFWDFKAQFHAVRHGYAITSHRAQGSTYEKAYVNWRDIMLNSNRSEAYRCLYVAASRPKKELYLG